MERCNSFIFELAEFFIPPKFEEIMFLFLGMDMQAAPYRAFTIIQKRAAFWSSKIDADQHQPSRLRRYQLFGRGRAPVVNDISASVLHDFFDDKVAAVRAAINADPPHFTPAPAGCVLNEFLPITPADVVVLISALPDKQSATDPLRLGCSRGPRMC